MAGGIQRVAVAVVEQSGCYLVGQRRPTDVLPGMAEFPGGKCRSDESAADAAVRECREETGLAVVADRLLYGCRHVYAHGTVDLEFWLCRPVASSSQSLQNGYRWAPAGALQSLDFPEANRPVLALLAGPLSSGR